MNPRSDPAAEPLVARDATYHRASDALRERVRANLAKEARGARRFSLWAPLATAAAFAAVALVAWNLALLGAAPREDELLQRDLVAAHVRSLMAEGHLNDVASSDQHTVKPWFAGKLDFAPPVQDLSNAGFVLAGGRLDYVDGRAVAAITYRYRRHVVNVFIWPAGAPQESPVSATSRQGYSILQWSHAGMRYAAVSDAAAAQLQPLADALVK
jgi:anti-sigma factor RsiW